nr:zinc finger protein jing-like isoform X2 [Biomphalaria glabrata]
MAVVVGCVETGLIDTKCAVEKSCYDISRLCKKNGLQHSLFFDDSHRESHDVNPAMDTNQEALAEATIFAKPSIPLLRSRHVSNQVSKKGKLEINEPVSDVTELDLSDSDTTGLTSLAESISTNCTFIPCPMLGLSPHGDLPNLLEGGYGHGQHNLFEGDSDTRNTSTSERRTWSSRRDRIYERPVARGINGGGDKRVCLLIIGIRCIWKSPDNHTPNLDSNDAASTQSVETGLTSDTLGALPFINGH